MTATALGLELPFHDMPPAAARLPIGGVELPVDEATRVRFRSKCAPYADDAGHIWWTGAIDGRSDSSGGYGRFQAGDGDNAVICIAHRLAWTFANGPVPDSLVVRHRCDEPLCVALTHLELGTPTDNRWDALDRPFRQADRDVRGSAGRSRAIRAAVREFLSRGIADPRGLGIAVREAMALGDPDRDQLKLWGDYDQLELGLGLVGGSAAALPL